MRVALSVVALVVAVFALGMAFLSGGGEQQNQGSDEVARLKAGVSALERRMADLRSGLDEVLAELADMRAAATAAHPQQPSQKPETSPPKPSTTSSPSAAQPPLSNESLRKMVREEIQRYQEERRKQYAPEKWENKEFGSFAWMIHHIGEKLGLSREQKRAYFQVIKRFYKGLGEVWKRIRSEMRGASYSEIRKAVRERQKEVLEQARREVESLLTPQQRAKYRELIEKDPYLRNHP
ncbi:MAG: hypothetical protein DRP63_06970 [Planctomycetota bacterium]|nr:MAG: hypothetical protein DRP63_06970 [Planctomycetota bacterium]